jgi:hypothetical protein
MPWRRDRERPVTIPEHGSHGRITSMRTIPAASGQELHANLTDFLENTTACLGAFSAAPTG